MSMSGTMMNDALLVFGGFLMGLLTGWATGWVRKRTVRAKVVKNDGFVPVHTARHGEKVIVEGYEWTIM